MTGDFDLHPEATSSHRTKFKSGPTTITISTAAGLGANPSITLDKEQPVFFREGAQGHCRSNGC